MLQRNHSHFGDAVVELLAQKGLTKAQLAKILGVSPAYVSQTTTGACRPSARWVNEVADALKLNANQRFDLHMDAATDHGFFQVDHLLPKR